MDKACVAPDACGRAACRTPHSRSLFARQAFLADRTHARIFGSASPVRILVGSKRILKQAKVCQRNMYAGMSA